MEKRALPKVLLLPAILVLGIWCSFLPRTSVAKADTVTGWYEQQSGVSEDLWSVSAADAYTVWAVGNNGTILKTADSGATWVAQASGTGNHLRSVSAVDANIAWSVGTSGTILETVDGGTIWSPQVAGGAYSFSGISAADSNNAWAVGSEYSAGTFHGVILNTSDGGGTWNPQPSSGTYSLSGVSAVNNTTAWVVGSAGAHGFDKAILKTVDGGLTWTPQTCPPDILPYKISAIDTNTAWAVGSNIIATKDGGTTWTTQESGTSATLEDVVAVDGQTAWAVGSMSGYSAYNRIVLKTSDAGSTWSMQTPQYALFLLGVTASDANTAWAVGGQGTIIHTTGGGKEYTRYFAEGYTGQGFQEYLCLGNPQEETATIIVNYIFKDGATQEEKLTIPPLSRTTINVNSQVGEGKEVSAKVVSDKEISVERPMYFSYNGVWSGGHDSEGATTTDSSWYFAEGYTGSGFEEWICVLNPGGQETDITFNFQTQEAGPLEKTGFKVPAHSRSTFKINDVLGSGFQNSLKLESRYPVVAERPMYFDYQGIGDHHWQGGSCVVGLNDLSKTYYLAEGTTRTGFEEWLTLQNPGQGTVNVTVAYQPGPEQGDSFEKTYVLNPLSRFSVYVPNEVGEGKDVAVTLTGDNAFVVERPMYFDYTYGAVTAQGGDCVMPAISPSSDWFFAEGYTGGGYHEWLCLENPNDEASTVEVIYCTQEAGILPAASITVPPQSRSTIMVNEQAGSGYQLSTRLKVAAGPNIVAERAMYFNAGGYDGGHAATGFSM